MLPFMDILLHRSPVMPNMVKVHVTYDETRRFVSYKKGGDVQGLRCAFLQVFSDVLSSDIAPGHVKFQRYDDEFEDYVELQNDERVEDQIKIRALISKPFKQAAGSSSSDAESEVKPHYCPHNHCVFPWIKCSEAIEGGWHPIRPGKPIFQRPHQIKKNTTYRLWSLVSRQNDSLIHRDPKTNIVNCSGSFNSGLNTVVTSSDETSGQGTFYVALIFRDAVAQKDYAITGNGLGKDITATELQPGGHLDDKSIFEPLYYWSYTMFRNKSYHTPELYLGCDNTGKTTLVKNWDLDYPNPQALFVLNRFVLI